MKPYWLLLCTGELGVGVHQSSDAWSFLDSRGRTTLVYEDQIIRREKIELPRQAILQRQDSIIRILAAKEPTSP
jgi:hypothetical protein